MRRLIVASLIVLACGGCCCMNGSPEMPASEPTVSSVLRVPESNGEFNVKSIKLSGGQHSGRQLQRVDVKGYSQDRGSDRQFSVVFGNSGAKVGSPRAAIIRDARVVRLDEVVERWALAAVPGSAATLSWTDASVSDAGPAPVAMAAATVTAASAASLQEETPAVAVESEEAFALAIGIAPIIMSNRVRMTSSSTSIAVETKRDWDRAFYLGPASGKPVTVTLFGVTGGPNSISLPPLHFVEVPGTLRPGQPLPTPRPIAGNPAAEAFAKFIAEIAAASGLTPSEIAVDGAAAATATSSRIQE